MIYFDFLIYASKLKAPELQTAPLSMTNKKERLVGVLSVEA